jgi:hypothetical protein
VRGCKRERKQRLKLLLLLLLMLLLLLIALMLLAVVLLQLLALVLLLMLLLLLVVVAVAHCQLVIVKAQEHLLHSVALSTTCECLSFILFRSVVYVSVDSDASNIVLKQLTVRQSFALARRYSVPCIAV